MADDLKQIQEIENRIKAIYAKIGKEVPAKLLDNKSIEDANVSLSTARTILNDLEGSASNLYDQLKGITTEFKGQRTSINESRSSLRKLTDIARELKFNEQGINELSSQQIKTLTRRFNVQSAIFQDAQEARTDEILGRSSIEKQINQAIQGEEDKNAAILEYLSILEGVTEEERALLYLRYSQEDPIQGIVDKLKEAEEFENKITSAIGLTGAAFENLNKIGVRAFGGLGINLGTLQEGFESANEAMRAQAISDMDKKMSSFAKRTRTLTAGLQVLGPSLKDTFTDPLILANGLANAFFDIDKAATSLANTTGQTFKAFDGLTGRFATAVDLAEVIVAETEQSGLNANNIFSKDVLAGAAEFKNLVGGSAEEIAGLLSLTAATGMNTDLIQESIVDTTSAFNGANRAAISQRRVLQDVLTTSNSVKASFAGNPKALAEAASAARRLGLSLSEVDSIASSLIDFESSITAELEAQLLTGRSINLVKARELALNNDITGLTNEIFKNQVSVAEFSQMNRIQQEGLAKALGMSRDQLANMAFQQAKMNGLTNEAAAAAAGVSLSDMQRAEAVEALQKTLTALLQTLAPALNLLSSFVGLIAKVPNLSMSVLGLGIAFKTLGIPISTAIGGVKSMFTYMKDTKSLANDLYKSFKKLGPTITDGVLGKKISIAGQFKKGGGRFEAGATKRVGGLFGKKVKDIVKDSNSTAAAIKESAEKVTDSTKKLNNASKGIPPSPKAGMGLRFFFTNLGKGLGAFGKGAAPAIPVLLSIAAVAAGIGVAFAGLGFGINQAAEGIVNLTDSLTLDKVKTLYAAAGAIGSLSASLASFALFGTLALPALLAVTPLLTGLNAAGDAGEAEGQNAMAKIEEKLDTLIGVVKEDRVVKISIDGKEVMEAILLKDSKM